MGNNDIRDVVRAPVGEQRAPELLVHGAIPARARGLRLNAADSADVVQSVWLKLLELIDSLREPPPLGADDPQRDTGSAFNGIGAARMRATWMSSPSETRSRAPRPRPRRGPGAAAGTLLASGPPYRRAPPVGASGTSGGSSNSVRPRKHARSGHRPYQSLRAAPSREPCLIHVELIQTLRDGQ
jgi:hypothetical protein